jgi:hypothetical protein
VRYRSATKSVSWWEEFLFWYIQFTDGNFTR